MAFLNIGRLKFGTALGLLLTLSAPALAVEAAKPEAAAPEISFDIESVDTFAGAFLAGRTADGDYDYESAITLYRTALKFDPSNLEVRERLMICLFMNGDFDEGVAEAVKLKDDPAVERIAKIARGIDAIRKKDFKEAYKFLKYEGPNELDRMINTLIVAWGQFGEGKSKEAIASAIGLKGPEWFSVFRNYTAGMIAAAAGDIETARKKLSETVANREEGTAASDTYMRAVIALATLEARAGNRQKALDAISSGEVFAPGYIPLQAFRKKIEAGEKPEFAISDATQGMASVLFSVGGALNQSLASAPDRASAQDIVTFYLVTANALSPADADTAVLLGGLAEANDKPEKAIEWYRKVPEGSILRRIADLQLGLNLAGTGKTEEAREHLKAAIAADPRDTRAYLAYGSLLSDNKEYAEMAANYDKAVEVIGPMPKRTDWSIFFQRGIAYERLKKWDLAEPNFRKALALYPDQPQVLNYLGYSWVDMNINLAEGLEMIRKAVDLRPDDGYIVDSLGWAYYRLGRYDDAVSELERAVDLRASDATINDHLGDAYWRVGRKLEAIFQWKTSLELKPEPDMIPKLDKKIREGLPPVEASAETTKSVKMAETKASAAQTKAAEAAKPAPAAEKPADAAPAEPAAVLPAAEQEPAAAPAVTEVAPTAEAGAHTVVNGDSLWTIARDRLGDGHRFREIIELNPDLKRRPDALKPGQVLKLPAKN
jgi:tetratricopeptide (TPR) repeat protein